MNLKMKTLVAAAMLDGVEHWSNPRVRLAAYYSSDTTHLDLRESRMRNVVRVVAANSSRVIGAGPPSRNAVQMRCTCAR